MSREEADDRYMAALDRFAEEDWEGAIALFQQSAAADPTYLDAWHGIARACFEARETRPDLLDLAIDAAQRIVAIDPDDVAAYSTLSQCYVWKGDKDTAEHWGGKARVAGWKQQLKDDKRKQRGEGPDPDKQIG
jgi:tetratricopeptide (TPR) repeat protein